MIETESREIGGYLYSVAQLGAKEGRRILVKLTKMIGPSLGQLMEAGESNISKAVSGAIYELSANLQESDLDDLCRIFGERTEVEIEGKPQKLDLKMQELHFAGKYGDMLKWIGFCLELNYKDFFKALGDLAPVGNEKLLKGLSKKQ